MSTTINDRVGQLVKELGMNNNSFAKSIGKSSSTINYIVDGRTKPGYELLESIISKYPKISSEWLMKGEGAIFHPPLPNDPQEGAYLRLHLEKLEEQFVKLVDQLSVKDGQIAGLQRMLEATLEKSFPEPASETGSVIPLWREKPSLMVG